MPSANLSLTNRRFFFTCLLITWVLSALYLVGVGKEEAFTALHPGGATVADGVMKIITHVGDGLFSVAVVIIMLLRRQWVSASLLALAYSISGLAAQLLKHLTSLPRPLGYFRQKNIDIYTLPDVDVHLANSFPSGHAASVFALVTSLAIIFRVKWLTIPLLLLAWVVAYSRVYLAQHFAEDIWIGSLLGVSGALLARWIVLYWLARYPRFRNTPLIPHD